MTLTAMLGINVRLDSVSLMSVRIIQIVLGLTRPAMLTMITASTVAAVTVPATQMDAVKVTSILKVRN